jgi:hypothetical protein
VTTPQQSSTRPTRPAAFASIRLDPTRGPRGTTITVTGSGFPAGASVQIRYSGTLASTSTTATSDANGDFSAQLQANGTLPGSYDVTATGDGQSASATFQQTT